MKRTPLIIAVLLLSLLLLLSGCSKAESYSQKPADAYHAPGEGLSYNEGKTDSAVPDISKPHADVFAGRKVIRNASLTVETLEFDRFITDITNKTNELGGYIQSNEVSGRRYNYSSSSLRYAETVVRIPTERLDEFLAAVDGAGNVVSRTENVDDVTETYTDIEARLSSLRTEYDTLLGLLEKAEGLDEIITLQDRLTNVRYEIESYEGKQRLYDNRIAYSTVSLNISEVERVTPVEEESFGHEVSRRFKESLADVGEFFREFAVWFIGDLPKIAIVLFFIVGLPLIIVFIIIKSIKRANRKRAARRAALAEKTADKA